MDLLVCFIQLHFIQIHLKDQWCQHVFTFTHSTGSDGWFVCRFQHTLVQLPASSSLSSYLNLNDTINSTLRVKSFCNATVTNKTDIVRFQRFAHHRLI